MRLRGSTSQAAGGRGPRQALAALAVCTLLGSAAAVDLFQLVETGSAEQVQQAMKGSDVNSADDVGRTALMHAAAYNTDPQVIAVLVRAGARVNARGPRQWTALMMAAYQNPNPAVVEALLKAGASTTLRSDAGETAYDYGRDNDKLRGTPTYARLRSAVGQKVGAGQR